MRDRHNKNQKIKLSRLLEEWERKAVTQSDYLFSEYLEVFDRLFKFAFYDANGIGMIQDKCEKITKNLLKSETYRNIIRGLKFIDNCYKCIEESIEGMPGDSGSNRCRFNLFFCTFDDMQRALNETVVTRIYNDFPWWSFIKRVTYCSITIEKPVNSYDCSDFLACEALCHIIGNAISKSDSIDENPEWLTLEIIDNNINLPSSVKTIFCNTVADYIYVYMIEHVLNGKYELIREGWLKNITVIFSRENYERISYNTLKLICYIFYLFKQKRSLYENVIIKDATNDFIRDRDARVYIMIFIRTLAGLDINTAQHLSNKKIGFDLFNENLMTILYDDLMAYEFPARLFKKKEYILIDIIDDFVTFTACYMAILTDKYEVIDKVIHNNLISCYHRYVTCDRKLEMREFFSLFDIDDSDQIKNSSNDTNDIESKVEHIYSVLRDKIKKQFLQYNAASRNDCMHYH